MLFKSASRNHGGGQDNHSLFRQIIIGNGGGRREGELLESINSFFGSFAPFEEKFAQAAITYFGSGWGWLTPK